jgi:hypothetical protein
MKFATLHESRRYWIAGIAIAVIGVLLSRVLAPRFDARLGDILKASGRLLGMGGLVVIAIGLNRRAKANAGKEEAN